MRPGTTVHRHVVRSALPVTALVAALALAACGSSGTGSASTATGSAASSSSAGTGASTPAATGSSSFVLLPESVLTPLPPLVYSAPAGADAAMVAQGAKPAVDAVFRGGISREFTYQGKTVGGVELYLFDPAVPADARAKFLPLMVQSFAQVTPKPATLAGTKVQVADGARGTAISVVAWTQGEDLVLIWGSGLPATEQIAAQYIAQSR